MTAKELRQMAERVDKESTRLANESGLKCAGEHVLDCIELAIYVLSTVRDDDDEPAGESYATSVGWIPHSQGEWHFYNRHSSFPSLIYHSVNQVWMIGNSATGWTKLELIKTRGQFRSLCRGLGIELKEEKTKC